jgi:hypothetical protein
MLLAITISLQTALFTQIELTEDANGDNISNSNINAK